MADPIVTLEELEARLGRVLSDSAQAEALISDASDLVRQVARSDFPTGVPRVLVPVVVQMVRRALDNPTELQAENIGGYGYQAASMTQPSGGSIYLTRAERRIVREAAGRPAVIGIDVTTGFGDPLTGDDE